MSEQRIIDGHEYSRFTEVDKFVAWASGAGWGSGAVFEAATGNTIQALVRRKRWVRSYIDLRGRHRFDVRGAHNTVAVPK